MDCVNHCLFLYLTVELSIEDVKTIIMTRSVRMNLFHMVIGGLPWSGKSELIKSILSPKEKSTTKPLGLELHEAIIQRSIIDDSHQWMLASELQDNIFTTSILLTHFFSQHSQLPRFKLNESSLQRVFDDDEIQEYMETTFQSLKKMVFRFQNEEEVKSMFRGTLSYVNIFDIGVNNAVHEFLMAVEDEGSNYLLINMLNITKCDREVMKEPLNFLHDKRYKGRYTETVQTMYKRHNALYHFMVGLEAAAATRDSTRLNSKMEDDPKPNAIIVGTHWDTDDIRIDSDTLEQRRKDLMELINAYAHDIGMESTSFLTDMVTLNMSDGREIELLKNKIIDLMEQNKKFFEVEIPLRFYFLRWVLFNTKKLFISREELTKYAKKLSMESEEEIRKFLDIFRGCGSIISSPLEKEFLYNYFILLPIEFVRGLDRLYSVHTDTSLPEEIRKPTQYGIVSDELVRSVWQGPPEGSLSPSEFYVNVLKNVGLMMDLNGKYLMPSLKLEYDDSKPKPDSLIITANKSAVSFRKQCSFLNEFISNPLLKDKIQFTECPIYNIATFDWVADGITAKISIQFNREYIQISVDSPSTTARSVLKTACVAIMNRISADKLGVRYEFCVVCPKSGHFVPFDVLDTSINELKCPKCSKSFSANFEWIKCAYTGNIRAVLHYKGK